MSVSYNQFDYMRERMHQHFGAPALQHPHPGIIGPGLNMHQAMYSMLPTNQTFDHLKIPYDANQPVILSCEPIQPVREEPETVDMSVD